MMETHTLRNTLSLIAGMACFLLSPLSAAAEPPNSSFDEELVIKRLKEIEDPLIEHRYNSVVKGYIRGYLTWNRDNAERILGRTVLYFPVIEKYLQQNNMPEKLKYLPVVESALNPHARSPVGAVGLWQFMPATAREYGLNIDEYTDERQDPNKATLAALKYLSRQYEKYEDWALALAAYNGGSGRVSRAIKRSRSKNFWRLSRYLPRETRNYIPAYIGATYLMEYYKEHEILPEYPILDLQITETAKVYEYYSFYRIAQITGLPLEVITMLNPAYRREIIPANPEGNYLILPKRVMPAFKDYLEAQRPDHLADEFFDDSPVSAAMDLDNNSENYVKRVYTAKEGETLKQIARSLNCSIHQIIAWNGLQSTELKEGQLLTIYQPKKIVRFRPLEKMRELPPIFTKAPKPGIERITDGRRSLEASTLLYVVPEKKTLEDIARDLPGMPLPALIDLNRIPPNRKLHTGHFLKVPRY